jgi:hypothetical protein
MNVTDEMTAAQIIALIERLSEKLDDIHSDCASISVSLEMLRETDRSKKLENAEKWAYMALGIISRARRALKNARQLLTD